MISPSIYDYVKSEETRFESEEIQVGNNWYWNFKKHVQLIFHLKNGVFFTGENNWLRAFKEVMQPMIDLSNWTEDIEVKDTVFYIEGKDDRVMSFLIKKYHDEVYTHEHDLDKLFDDIAESDNSYGGVLVQEGVDTPEVIKLKKIAFCDQSDILGGPLAFKYDFSPDKLRMMSDYGWGKESNGATISIEDLCVLANTEKSSGGLNDSNKTKSTGKTIEVYIVKGNLPEHYLEDNDNMEDWYNQTQIIAYYTDKDSKQVGVTLYRKKSYEDMLFFTSNEVEDRALGRGVGEKLIHPQIWTNFLTIHKMNMLEAGSKVPLYTDDPTYTTKNKIQDMENLEITTIEENKRIYQVPTVAPANVTLFQNAVNEWYQQAQLDASAFDSIMGKEESAGTTFKGQERLVAQGRGSHDRKRGKRAKFIELIYRKMIIPDMKKEILKGKEFLAELTADELTWVAEQVAINEVNDFIVDKMLNGVFISKEEQMAMMQEMRDKMLKKGTKHLLKILKDELKDAEIAMGINVAGKQKNLANLSDKILNIFQYVFANPQGFQQAMQIPALSKAFSDILEFSGMSQIDFASLITPAQSNVIPPTPQTPQIGQPELQTPDLMQQNG